MVQWSLGTRKGHAWMCLTLPFYHDSQKFNICRFLEVGGFLKFFPSGVWVCHPSTLLSYVFGRLCEFATLKPIAIPLVRPENRLQDHLEGRIWLVYCITTIFAQRALNLTSTFYSFVFNLNSRDTPPMNHAGGFSVWKLSIAFCSKVFWCPSRRSGSSNLTRQRWVTTTSHDQLLFKVPMLSGGRWDAGRRRIWIRGTVPGKHRNM